MIVVIKKRSLVNRIIRLPTLWKFNWNWSKGSPVQDRVWLLYSATKTLLNLRSPNRDT
ncbi:hypothetical protein [Spirosoma fluminis]